MNTRTGRRTDNAELPSNRPSGGSTSTLYLGLGSNLGDREGVLHEAISRLCEHLEIKAVSPWYETMPVGKIDQPDFLNLVLEARTGLTPREVIDLVLAVERALGRQRRMVGDLPSDEAGIGSGDGELNGPRIIDIDLLLYGREVVDEPGVQVPHPRLHERAFVLVPFADVAPTLVHPTLGRSIAELLDSLTAEARSGVRRFERSTDTFGFI